MKFLTPTEEAALKKETSDTIENKIKPIFDAAGAKTEIFGAEIKRLVAQNGSRFVEVQYHFNYDKFIFEYISGKKCLVREEAWGNMDEISKKFSKYLKNGYFREFC